MDVLERPEYKRLWETARRRLEGNGLTLEGGPIVLNGLSSAEGDAVAGLLGVRRPTTDSVRVPLTKLDAVLRSSAVGVGLVEVLERLGGPLVDRRARRQERDADRAARWAEVGAHPAVHDRPELGEWVADVRTTGLARRLAGDDETLAVTAALDVVATIGTRTGRDRLAVLAASVTGDAHALDRGRPVGTLAVHALARLAGRALPRDAADWRRVWSDAGVDCDDLSCDVLVMNLPGWPADPLRLTLRQVSRWQPPRGSRCVSVTENPAVIAAAADLLGDDSPTMVCLDGMPSTAALIVLERLARAGFAVRYHGDFDWRGLAIAGVLARKIPSVEPWLYRTDDYRQAVGRGLGTVPLSGATVASPWDPALAPSMQEAGVAVYEEQVIGALLDDLAR